MKGNKEMNFYPQMHITLLWLLQVITPDTNAQMVKTVTIANTLHEQRKDELVLLGRDALEKKLGAISDGHYLSVLTRHLKAVVVQHDDLNGDGKWDEAAFLYSFGPKEKAQFKLAVAATSNPAPAASRAHVRLKKIAADDSFGPSIIEEEMPLRNQATDFSKQPLPLYLTEGPGWENDRVAFRLYFDVRNGKDIFAKRTARMVLDSVGVRVHPSYHELQDWGMDVLHVGKSLGSGALALLVPQKGREDTLVRVGGEHMKRTIYRQLSDGPVRALFAVSYDWQIHGQPVKVVEQTSIWGGQYFYESTVRVEGAPGDSRLVTGIANFYDNVFQSFSAGTSEVFLSHGRQSENKDFLGMAVIVPQQAFAFAGSAPTAGSDILNTYIIGQNISAGKPCSFRFYAGWEKTDHRFASQSFFKDLLVLETKKLAAPLKVIW